MTKMQLIGLLDGEWSEMSSYLISKQVCSLKMPHTVYKARG